MAFSNPDFSVIFLQKHTEDGRCLPCLHGNIENNAWFHEDTYVTPNPSVLSKKTNHNAIETVDDIVRVVFNFVRYTQSENLTTKLFIKKIHLCHIIANLDTLDFGHVPTENCCCKPPGKQLAGELETWRWMYKQWRLKYIKIKELDQECLGINDLIWELHEDVQINGSMNWHPRRGLMKIICAKRKRITSYS